MTETPSNSSDASSFEGNYPTPQPSVRRRFSLRTLFVVVLVLCVLLAGKVAITNAVRRVNQTRQCSEQMKTLALALLCYRDNYKAFPPAITYAQDGTPLYSWRVLVHPWVEQFNFRERFDLSEPWNGPKNRLLCDETPDTFRDSLSMKINDRSKRSLSSYHGGACVVHADGSVETVEETLTEERVRELLAR